MPGEGPRMEVIPLGFIAGLLRRFDRHAARIRRQLPGVRYTRAGAVRALLEARLDAPGAKEPLHGQA